MNGPVVTYRHPDIVKNVNVFSRLVVILHTPSKREKLDRLQTIMYPMRPWLLPGWKRKDKTLAWRRRNLDRDAFEAGKTEKKR